MTSASPICEEVDKYLRRKKESPDTPWANPSGSLGKSAECGCRYCYAACDAVGKDGIIEQNKRKNIDARLRNSELKYRSFGGNKNVEDTVHVEFRGSGLNFYRQDSSSELFVQNKEDDPTIPVSAPISGYTGSAAGFRTVMKWLEECVKTHHTLCPTLGSPAGAPRLPFRVLEVNIPGTQNVRLLQTDNEKGYYASLSHCWGGEQPLKTTLSENKLELHQQGIKWEDLPKTFQEAVAVTRAFGIQYLWIDSLCIVQDDDHDWQIQSAQMANIYQNSLITFAGSASSGPRQGVFRYADPEHIDHGISGTAMPKGLDKVRKRKPLSHAQTDLPLMQRGWVFQERLLSPRYLHFGQNELIWECMERLTCECGGLGFLERSRFDWLKPKNRLHPFSLQLLNSRARGVAGAWQDAVADYSHMTLSYPSDIFPAISGIAKSVKDTTGWEYVAGLWRENLITDLLWRVETPQLARRCKDWRAPTFSWASVIPKKEGSSWISYGFMDFLEKGLEEQNPREWRTDVYAEVVETDCVPKGQDNPTGVLTSGYIILSGTLIQATLRCTTSQAQWKITSIGGESLSASMFRNDYDFHEGHSRLGDGDMVYCLKLIGLSKVPDHDSGEYLLHLVLRKIVRSRDSLDADGDVEFERIGLLRDARGPEAEKLEDVSEERAIQRDATVKII